MISTGAASALQIAAIEQRRQGQRARSCRQPRQSHRDPGLRGRRCWRAASAARPVRRRRRNWFELIDVGQHLGHGGIERRGNLVADLGMAMQGARQRRRFEHRHLVLGGQLANPVRPPGSCPWPPPAAPPCARVSYFSATAKCVGLVTTTSALGTSAIMRRRAISRCWLRMRALTCGSPSISLNSWRSSSLVMRKPRSSCQSWKGTSIGGDQRQPDDHGDRRRISDHVTERGQRRVERLA